MTASALLGERRVDARRLSERQPQKQAAADLRSEVGAPSDADARRNRVAVLGPERGALRAAQAAGELARRPALEVVAPQFGGATQVVAPADALRGFELALDARARSEVATQGRAAERRVCRVHLPSYRPSAGARRRGALRSGVPSLPIPPSRIERALRDLGFSKTEARRVLALGLFAAETRTRPIAALERTLRFDFDFSAREARAFIARGLPALRCTPTVPAPAARGRIAQ